MANTEQLILIDAQTLEDNTSQYLIHEQLLAQLLAHMLWTL